LCDPARWVPEAARLLRAGGRLVFHTSRVLAAVCCPDPPEPAHRKLLRPQREARRLVTAAGGTEFHPGHGEWIAILRASGFVIDDLREIYAGRRRPDREVLASPPRVIADSNKGRQLDRGHLGVEAEGRWPRGRGHRHGMPSTAQN